MKIPSYTQYNEWKKFLAGMVIGAIVSWFVFLYIFGEWHEQYTTKLKKQEEEIRALTEEKKIWQADFAELNKKNKEKLTIQKIEVKITNFEKYKLDYFSVHQMEEAVEKDIRSLLTKDIETAFLSRELIRRAIENKSFKILDKRYNLSIKEIVFYTTLTINVSIQLED